MEVENSAMDSSISRSGSGESSSANTDIENISSSSKSSTSSIPSQQPSQQPSKSSCKDSINIKRLPSVELFIGDLSFFCNERNLLDLFAPFGKVLQTAISRCDNGGHSLLHGFMKMSDIKEAEIAAAKLNDSPFMGRTLRVQVCSLDGARLVRPPRPGYHVHVSFAADATVPNITEEKLRSTFESYGAISDVIVKRHSRMKNPSRQKGYGFVYFYSKEHAELAVSSLNGKAVDDIIYECAMSCKKEPDVVANNVCVSNTQTQVGNQKSKASPVIQEGNSTGSMKNANQQPYRSVPAIKPTTHGSGRNSYASLQQVPCVDNGMHQRGPHGPQFQLPIFSPQVVYLWAPPPPPPPLPVPVSYDMSHMLSEHHPQQCAVNQMHHLNTTEALNELSNSVNLVKEISIKDTSSQHVVITNSSGPWVSTNSMERLSDQVGGMPLFLCGHPLIQSTPNMSHPADGCPSMTQQPVPQQHYIPKEHSAAVNASPMQIYGPPPPPPLPPKPTQPSSASTNGNDSNPYGNNQNHQTMRNSSLYSLPQQNNLMRPIRQSNQYYYYSQYGQNAY